MIGLLARASRRHARTHPWQVGLAVLGMAVGVAVVVGMDLAIESARSAFRIANEAVMGRTTHQIVGGDAGVEEALYPRLRRELPDLPAAPVVEGQVTVGGGRRAWTLLGVDPFAARPFRTDIGPVGQGDVLVPFLVRTGAAVVTPDTARILGVTLGDLVEVRVGGRRERLEVVGLVAARDELGGEGMRDLLVADLSTAQEVLGRPGRLTRIDLLVAEGPRGDAQLAAVAGLLPEGARIVSGAARSRVAVEMTRAFELNLVMLSLLALVIGIFLIYNTMAFSVVRRRILIGTLRALGVTRGEILLMVLAEAALIAAVGALAGLAAGVVLARQLTGLVARTIDDLYFSLEVQAVVVSPASLLEAGAIGIGAGLLAALAPALEASRVTPRSALLRSHLEARVRRAAPWLGGAGLALAALAGLALAWPGERVEAGFAALFALVGAFALLAPVATRRIAECLAPAGDRVAGVLGPLALRGITASLSRTAVAVAALMVALSAIVAMGVMVDSFRRTVATWLDTTLQADLYLGVAGGAAVDRVLPPELPTRLRALAEVEAVSTGRRREVLVGDEPVALVAIEMAPGSYQGFRFVAGDPERAWSAFDTGGAVLLGEPWAYRRGLHPGDEVELLTPRGPRTFAVAAVYRDYEGGQGTVVMSRATYDRDWDDAAVSSLGIYLAPGADEARTRAVIEALLPVEPAIAIRSNRAIREASLAIFDRTFTITEVLRLLAAVVAAVGLLGALMALELERAREIATLRVLGLTRGQVFGLVQSETGALGLIAGLLAVPLGMVMALVLIVVINRRSFGWGMEIHVDPLILASALTLGVVTALAAGLYPAWRLAVGSPAAALREE